MRYFRSREDSLRFGLSFFLIAGAVVGTVFCNRMDGSMKAELRSLETSMVSAAVLQRVNFSELFLRVLSRRLPELFFGFLIAMTSAAPLLFLGVCGYLGFSAAVMVCALTMEAGLLGIVRYFVLLFPQALFYVPVIYVLVWRLPLEEKKLRPAAALALTAAVVLGAAAESLLNPWLVAFLL